LRLPHIAAYKLQFAGALFAQHSEEPQEGFGCAILADPEEPLPPVVDLPSFGLNRGQRQILVPLLPLHPFLPQRTVDADRLDVLQVAVLQAP